MITAPTFLAVWKQEINRHIDENPVTGAAGARLEANPDDWDSYYGYLMRLYPDRLPISGPNGGVYFRGVETFPVSTITPTTCSVLCRVPVQ